jgi:hypothetical protein
VEKRGIMKLWFRNVVFIAVLAFVFAAVARGQAQQVTITISAPQAEVKIGAPVILHIVMTNLSQQVIYVPRYARVYGERFNIISVLDSEGNAPPTTQYGKAIRYPGANSMSGRMMVVLKPGEKLEEDSTISNVFDMKSAGTYKVSVTRPCPLDGNVTLKSNEISITVTD